MESMLPSESLTWPTFRQALSELAQNDSALQLATQTTKEAYQSQLCKADNAARILASNFKNKFNLKVDGIKTRRIAKILRCHPVA